MNEKMQIVKKSIEQDENAPLVVTFEEYGTGNRVKAVLDFDGDRLSEKCVEELTDAFIDGGIDHNMGIASINRIFDELGRAINTVGGREWEEVKTKQKVTARIQPLNYLLIKKLSQWHGVYMSEFIDLAIEKHLVELLSNESNMFIQVLATELKAHHFSVESNDLLETIALLAETESVD